LGLGKDKQVEGAQEYDKAKEKAGFIAGKHIQQRSKWWFQQSKKEWAAEGPGESSPSDNSNNKS
jgi:hypothetical protein